MSAVSFSKMHPWGLGEASDGGGGGDGGDGRGDGRGDSEGGGRREPREESIQVALELHWSMVSTVKGQQ